MTGNKQAYFGPIRRFMIYGGGIKFAVEKKAEANLLEKEVARVRSLTGKHFVRRLV